VNNEIGAIVIGGHFQGLGVVRALGREGIPVAVLDKGWSLSKHSKYTTKYLLTPNILDNDRYLEYLLTIYKTEGLKGWVIFPTDDETVGFLAKNREILQSVYRLMTPEWEVIKYAYNKKLSYKLARKLKMPIPLTFYPDSVDDLQNLDIPFPLIIKPAVMRDFFRKTGKKVYRARNTDELYTNYRKALEKIPADEILIQEEIPEVSRNLFSYCPFFKNGKMLAQVTAQRPRQHPMDFGQASTYAVSVKVDELEKMGNQFLSEINYYGLGEVEFIRDPRDGIFKFLEINPRIWGWHTIAGKCGVNLPLLVYQDLTGVRVAIDGFTEGVKWSRLITDIATVFSEILKGRMTLKQYIQSMKGELEFAVFSLDDPAPFFFELLMLPYLWFKRGF